MESVYVKRENTITLDQQMQIEHDFKLLMEKDASHGKIYKCSFDPDANLDERLINKLGFLTALEFATVEEVMAYNQKAKSRPYDFKGFLVFSFGGFLYVLGEYIGVSVEQWIAENPFHLWDRTNLKSERAWLVGPFGKQLACILTDRHEDDQYVGDMKIAIRVKGFRGESPVVTITSLDSNNLAIEDGIRKDLQDFREIIQMCEFQAFQAFQQGDKPHDLKMFYKLYPNDQGSSTDLQRLKDLSFRICHAPLFWEFKERYRFAQMFWELAKEFSNFHQVVNLDSYLGNWINRIAKDRTGVIYKVWKKAKRGAPNDLISFHRAVMEHCIELEVGTTTMLDADADLLNLFPEAYPMAYVELFEKFPAHYPALINHMKRRSLGLYYGKKVTI